MKVKPDTLLLLACLVWTAAGANILRIGLAAYPGHLTALNLLLSATVFLLFQLLIFGRLVKKHTTRITGYGQERQFFLKFFDRKSFAIMAFMMTGSILLCMMPQNQWLSASAPLSWGIWRNIPFALLGLVVILLFYRSARQHQDRAFRWMWLTIVLSFGFYIPVVLWADAVPLIGILMIPKTCAYVWTVVIGYRAMIKEVSG